MCLSPLAPTSPLHPHPLLCPYAHVKVTVYLLSEAVATKERFTGSRSPVKVVAGVDTDSGDVVTFPLPVAVTSSDRSEVAVLSASWASKLP